MLYGTIIAAQNTSTILTIHQCIFKNISGTCIIRISQYYLRSNLLFKKSKICFAFLPVYILSAFEYSTVVGIWLVNTGMNTVNMYQALSPIQQEVLRDSAGTAHVIVSYKFFHISLSWTLATTDLFAVTIAIRFFLGLHKQCIMYHIFCSQFPSFSKVTWDLFIILHVLADCSLKLFSFVLKYRYITTCLVTYHLMDTWVVSN